MKYTLKYILENKKKKDEDDIFNIPGLFSKTWIDKIIINEYKDNPDLFTEEEYTKISSELINYYKETNDETIFNGTDYITNKYGTPSIVKFLKTYVEALKPSFTKLENIKNYNEKSDYVLKSLKNILKMMEKCSYLKYLGSFYSDDEVLRYLDAFLTRPVLLSLLAYDYKQTLDIVEYLAEHNIITKCFNLYYDSGYEQIKTLKAHNKENQLYINNAYTNNDEEIINIISDINEKISESKKYSEIFAYFGFTTTDTRDKVFIDSIPVEDRFKGIRMSKASAERIAIQCAHYIWSGDLTYKNTTISKESLNDIYDNLIKPAKPEIKMAFANKLLFSSSSRYTIDSCCRYGGFVSSNVDKYYPESTVKDMTYSAISIYINDLAANRYSSGKLTNVEQHKRSFIKEKSKLIPTFTRLSYCLEYAKRQSAECCSSVDYLIDLLNLKDPKYIFEYYKDKEKSMDSTVFCVYALRNIISQDIQYSSFEESAFYKYLITLNDDIKDDILKEFEHFYTSHKYYSMTVNSSVFIDDVSKENFIYDTLIGKLQSKNVTVGYNFRNGLMRTDGNYISDIRTYVAYYTTTLYCLNLLNKLSGVPEFIYNDLKNKIIESANNEEQIQKIKQCLSSANSTLSNSDYYWKCLPKDLYKNDNDNDVVLTEGEISISLFSEILRIMSLPYIHEVFSDTFDHAADYKVVVFDENLVDYNRSHYSFNTCLKTPSVRLNFSKLNDETKSAMRNHILQFNHDNDGLFKNTIVEICSVYDLKKNTSINYSNLINELLEKTKLTGKVKYDLQDLIIGFSEEFIFILNNYDQFRTVCSEEEIISALNYLNSLADYSEILINI